MCMKTSHLIFSAAFAAATCGVAMASTTVPAAPAAPAYTAAPMVGADLNAYAPSIKYLSKLDAGYMGIFFDDANISGFRLGGEFKCFYIGTPRVFVTLRADIFGGYDEPDWADEIVMGGFAIGANLNVAVTDQLQLFIGPRLGFSSWEYTWKHRGHRYHHYYEDTWEEDSFDIGFMGGIRLFPGPRNQFAIEAGVGVMWHDFDYADSSTHSTNVFVGTSYTF